MLFLVAKISLTYQLLTDSVRIAKNSLDSMALIAAREADEITRTEIIEHLENEQARRISLLEGILNEHVSCICCTFRGYLER